MKIFNFISMIEAHFMLGAILGHEVVAHDAIHRAAQASCSIPNALGCFDLNEFLYVCGREISYVTQFRLNYFRYFSQTTCMVAGWRDSFKGKRMLLDKSEWKWSSIENNTLLWNPM